MTLGELIYELRGIIRRENLYDDDRLDDRLLKHWIHNQRSLWLRNEMNKPRSVDEQVVQTLGCVPLEIADRSACPEFTTGYSVLQTSSDIPKVIELNNADGIIEVGPVDRIARPFSYVNYNRARFSGKGRFNQNILFAFRYGLRILVIATNMESGSFLKYMRYLKIRGVFENPEDVAQFTHLDGTTCYDIFSDDYPLNRWMWDYIRDMILKTNFQLLTTAPTDKANDATETLTVDTHEE